MTFALIRPRTPASTLDMWVNMWVAYQCLELTIDMHESLNDAMADPLSASDFRTIVLVFRRLALKFDFSGVDDVGRCRRHFSLHAFAIWSVSGRVRYDRTERAPI